MVARSSGPSPPPPAYNFAETPAVSGRDAWWETKRRRGVPVTVAGGAEEAEDTAGPAKAGGEEPGHGVHLPSPSYWPIVAATGILAAAYGLVYSYALMAAGVLVLVVSLYAWYLEPTSEEEE